MQPSPRRIWLPCLRRHRTDKPLDVESAPDHAAEDHVVPGVARCCSPTCDAGISTASASLRRPLCSGTDALMSIAPESAAHRRLFASARKCAAARATSASARALPWKPAVLERPVDRVRRLGHKRGVPVINFVARGTIAEGMLSVLTFKQSLLAGILEGGLGEVVLKGTRLSKCAWKRSRRRPATPTLMACAPPSPAPHRSSRSTAVRRTGGTAARRMSIDLGPNRPPRLPVPDPQTVQRLAEWRPSLLGKHKWG